ncbi:molybdate ABC transporter permease subunit [Coraliomargarita akajimensis]|uniref:Molybdenum transport system permease n=1 Tax=Coraliomargarita akajimensis (strain DSM 45221 / IAM 15411 / JCM 23193 / KCTC 12865 / 04OKA010-24) TaxID=583355 RepID=D5EKT5_CORAD|nr:molybdate ABC transporter permease subunit [Coraliomargarita akajimensis]ADE54992.1 molybdate ABC transporter, inner membrane subunit [Coraliomargarita akajimensis DSM 45221]
MPPLCNIVLSTVLWAALSTLCVLALATPLAYLLARREFPGKQVLATIASLPLVLPPTAVGYSLLKLLADSGPLGFLDILLTWKGVVLACSVMSFPLVLRTARVSFEAVDPKLESLARTLGRSPFRTFYSVTLPLASKGLLAASILGFTRAMGEFGATVIVAGNIPGQTQTLASAIYSAQQSGNDLLANTLLTVALLIGFVAVFLSEWLSRPRKGARS